MGSERNGLAESHGAADFREDNAYRRHDGGRKESGDDDRDSSSHERVLDEVLTFSIVPEALKHDSHNRGCSFVSSNP